MTIVNVLFSAYFEMKILMTMWCQVAFLSQATTNNLCSRKETLDLPRNGTMPVRVLALDFDGTASTLESEDFLQHINLANMKYRYGSRATKQMMDKKFQELFESESNEIQNIVMDTLEKLKHSSQRVSQGKILVLRETLANIENTMSSFRNAKQVQDYFLKGITVSGIKRVADKIHLCPGLIETLKHCTHNPANIISAGWSKKMIEIVFRDYKAPKNLVLHVGEIVFKNGVSTGKVIGILTAFDKRKIMTKLIKQHQNTNGYSIYVGNDFPDILAMLTADIGIAINYTPLFIRFLNKLGIATPPIREWRKTGACSSKEYLIYTAQSWYQIEELVFART